jgi:hypothetical protein
MQRKALIISASIASVVIGGCILAGAAMLEYKPAQQHVELDITPKCDGQPCKVSAK